MSKTLPPPTSLLGCIDHLADEIYIHKSNSTLDLLRMPLTDTYDNQYKRMGAYTSYVNQISPITSSIAQHGIFQFISLVQTESQAAIAIALNAGDGIVIKITNRSFLHKEGTVVACQLPPIFREDIDNFVVEIFPWVDRKNVRASDILLMKDRLEKHGLQFKAGDDRIDNIGRMPNGELVVLDGDALEKMPNHHQSAEQSEIIVDQWMRHIKDVFCPLYTEAAYISGAKSLITASPDFTERFSPLIQVKSIAPAPATSGSSFFTRFFHSHRNMEKGR